MKWLIWEIRIIQKWIIYYAFNFTLAEVLFSYSSGCPYTYIFLCLWSHISILLLVTKRKREKSQSWNVVKCCGMASVQILRRQGRVVSSSLHKPSAADMGVVRGVTEHSNWTSQTLKEASTGLPLMLPDLASGTERKCCRTRRGHRPSWPQSACQPADCGRKERVRREREKEAEESTRKAIVRETRGEKETRKEREEDKESIASAPIQTHYLAFGHRAPEWIHSSTPSHHSSTISLLPLPIKNPSLFPLYHYIPPFFGPSKSLISLTFTQWSLRPSIPPSWTAECEPDRPWSEWGSCQRPAAEPSLTGH